MISLIAAVSNNGVIGVDDKLPWKSSQDMAWFQAITYGKTVIMGRKTYDSLPASGLPGRAIIIATRDASVVPNRLYHHIDKPLARHLFDEALWTTLQDSSLEYIVIGGAEIYQQALPYVSKFYVSKIDVHVAYTPEQVLQKKVTHCPFPLPWDGVKLP